MANPTNCKIKDCPIRIPTTCEGKYRRIWKKVDCALSLGKSSLGRTTCKSQPCFRVSLEIKKVNAFMVQGILALLYGFMSHLNYFVLSFNLLRYKNAVVIVRLYPNQNELRINILSCACGFSLFLYILNIISDVFLSLRGLCYARPPSNTITQPTCRATTPRHTVETTYAWTSSTYKTHVLNFYHQCKNIRFSDSQRNRKCLALSLFSYKILAHHRAYLSCWQPNGCQ